MRNILKSLSLGLLAIAMSACTFSFGSDSFFNNSNNNDNISSSNGGNVTRDTTLIREVNEQIGWSTLESVGNQKMLIVPVQLKGETAWTSNMLTNINTVFFGDASDTNWNSVKSFFFESSYGKLNLSGEVTDPFVSRESAITLTRYGEEGADVIIDEWYSSASSTLLKNYDQDKDGFVDCAVFIYSNKYGSNYNTDAYNQTFWAWCYFHSTTGNASKPTINNFMWASYHHLFDGYVDNYNKGKYDAHTYIHETGHLLGLDDYYCYDEYSPWDCAGELEMQSYNVGDHNIYSKMALGWVDPIYVNTSTSQTVTIETSASAPQAILINDTWNGSTFDEYLLLEYYTPKGLNEVDSLHQYSSREKMYDYSGIRLYHIDARLAKIRVLSNSYFFESYVDKIGNDDRIYYVAASNSSEMSYLPADRASIYRYVHLLDKAGNNALNRGFGGVVVPGTALWTEGSKFIPTGIFFANGPKFNDGTEIGYSISVDSLTNTSATVTIEKLKRE